MTCVGDGGDSDEGSLGPGHSENSNGDLGDHPCISWPQAVPWQPLIGS